MELEDIIRFYRGKIHREFNIIPTIGCELEFYIEPRPEAPRINYLAEMRKLSLDIVEEWGFNQFELRLNHNIDVFALIKEYHNAKKKIADMLEKHAIRTLFDVKPFEEHPGSALHIHVSFTTIDECKDFKLQSTALTFIIGGLLHTLPYLMVFFAPNVSSYERYRSKSMFVPKYIAWGYNNRTTALRLLKDPEGILRIEHRVAGADANIMKVIIAILCGIYIGLSQEILPDEPIYGLGFDPQYNLKPLPKTLKEAKQNFINSQFAHMLSPSLLL